MLTSIVVRIVSICIGHARAVVAIGLLLAMGCALCPATHFFINSDINSLLPQDVGWRKPELAFENAFRRFELIEVVVEAPTPELTGAATAELTQALVKEKGQFRDVANVGGAEFFARHALLFEPKE